MPVADCGAFEVGERSEVGVLESPPSGSLLELRSNTPPSNKTDEQNKL